MQCHDSFPREAVTLAAPMAAGFQSEPNVKTTLKLPLIVLNSRTRNVDGLIEEASNKNNINHAA